MMDRIRKRKQLSTPESAEGVHLVERDGVIHREGMSTRESRKQNPRDPDMYYQVPGTKLMRPTQKHPAMKRRQAQKFDETGFQDKVGQRPIDSEYRKEDFLDADEDGSEFPFFDEQQFKNPAKCKGPRFCLMPAAVDDAQAAETPTSTLTQH